MVVGGLIHRAKRQDELTGDTWVFILITTIASHFTAVVSAEHRHRLTLAVPGGHPVIMAFTEHLRISQFKPREANILQPLRKTSIDENAIIQVNR
jgi:hypothetical protein